MSFLDLVTVWGQNDCAFSASLSPTHSFLSFNSLTFELSLASTDVNEIGDYSFTLTLSPDLYEDFVSDAVYSFQVSIKCTVTSFNFASPPSDVTYKISETAFIGNDFSVMDILPV